MVKRLQALDHPPASEAIRALTVRGLKDRRKPHDAPVLVRFQWWSGRAHYATTSEQRPESNRDHGSRLLLGRPQGKFVCGRGSNRRSLALSGNMTRQRVCDSAGERVHGLTLLWQIFERPRIPKLCFL